MDLLYRALEIAHETEDLSIESRISNNMGIIFRESNNFEQAEYYFEKSVQLKRALNDLHGEANTLTNLHELYLNKRILIRHSNA